MRLFSKFKNSKPALTPNPQAGFTLVEMMVAMTIFVVVAMTVTLAFITIADANRKAQSVRLVMDNLNFAIDSMALQMREGNNYVCNFPDLECDAISFSTFSGNNVTYGLVGNRIGKCETAGPVESCSTLSPITAPQVVINKFTVLLNNDETKRAVILIGGQAGTGKTKTDFNIQTTVSERN